MDKQTRTLTRATVPTGFWLLFTPFTLSFSSSVNAWQEFILGIAVVIFGFVRLTMPRIAWPSWANALTY